MPTSKTTRPKRATTKRAAVSRKRVATATHKTSAPAVHPTPRVEAAATRQGGTYAVGRRKTAVARVWLTEGTGAFTVNRKLLDAYFPTVALERLATGPLVEAGLRQAFDVNAVVTGGGKSGQAESVRHGIARALVHLQADLRPTRQGAEEVRLEARSARPAVAEAVAPHASDQAPADASSDRESYRRIARNTIYLTLAFVGQKLLSFLFFAYYSGAVGAESTGKVYTALTFASAFSIFIDIGFSPVLIREVARAPQRAQSILSNVLWLKSSFAVVTYVLLATVINVASNSSVTRELTYLAGIVVLFESFTLSIYGVLRGFQNLKYEAFGSILFQSIVFLVGGIGLRQTGNIYFIITAYILGAAANFGFSLFMLRHRYGVHFRLNFDANVLGPLLKIAIPFFIAGILTKTYASVDTIILYLFSGDRAVGWYSAAYKLVFALQFIPIALNSSIFPAFSRAFVASREALETSFRAAVRFLLLIAVPLTVALVILTDLVVDLRWASFTNTPPTLRILALSLPLQFLNLILASLLNATNHQKANTIHLGITVATNVVLDLILVPQFGHLGAAWASVAGAVVFTVLSLRFVPIITGGRASSLGLLVLKVLPASAAMGLVLWWLRRDVAVAQGFFTQLAEIGGFLAIGAAVFLITAFLTRTITRRDIQQAVGLFRRHA